MSDAMLETDRRDTRLWGGFLLLVYAALAVLPLAVVYWFGPPTAGSRLQALGNGAGLLGFSLLVLQFVLAARLHWLERPFGLDLVMAFHRGMGIAAFALLLVHPVLLALGHGGWSLFALDTPWPITVGKAAFVLLFLLVLSALLYRRLGMKYETWRRLHKGAILVLFLGFVHSLYAGEDLLSLGPRVFWFALFGLGAVVFLYRNVYVPLWGRRRFRVAGMTRESPDVWTLALDPEAEQAPFRYRPGQFCFLHLLRPGRPSEEHPFSLSSSPTDGGRTITVTIKASGDFTRTIGQTQIGDRALLEGPFGCFSPVHHDAQAFLFIAGGVGITPIMSMLRYLRDIGDPRPVRVLCANRTERDILFRDELDALPENTRVTHLLSAPEDKDWKPIGRVDAALIRRVAGPELATCDVYLCGPPKMMDEVFAILRRLGVAGPRIHCERFAL